MAGVGVLRCIKSHGNLGLPVGAYGQARTTHVAAVTAAATEHSNGSSRMAR